jgi:hypothetical protein
VMERLHGEPLVRRIERFGTMPLPEVVSILVQCCRALSRAHALGIVHRDVKPDNIYLAQSDDDDSLTAKVLDFGVAKLTSVYIEEVSSVTRTGSLIGTPAYMSPEQARALPSLDSRTDLYSLGLVAYSMLTGKQAHNASSLGDMLLQICAFPLPSLCGGSPTPLPPTMEAWFQRACAREPGDRFQTATAFGEALVEASGLPSSELGSIGVAAGPGKDGRSWSSVPAPMGSGPYPPAVAQSAPRMAPSTTGASNLAGDVLGLPSRKRGAFVAALAGLVTLAGIIGTITLVLRVRAPADTVLAASPTPESPSMVPEAPPPVPSGAPSAAPVVPASASQVAIVPDASAPVRPPAVATGARVAPPKPAAPVPRPTAKPSSNDNSVGY